MIAVQLFVSEQVRLLLIGTRDERSALRHLRGLEDSVLRDLVGPPAPFKRVAPL